MDDPAAPPDPAAAASTDPDEVIARAVRERKRRSARRRIAVLAALAVGAWWGASYAMNQATSQTQTVLSSSVAAGTALDGAITHVSGAPTASGTAPDARSGVTPELVGVVQDIASNDRTRRALGELAAAARDGLTEAELEALAPRLEGAVTDEQLDRLTCALDAALKQLPLANAAPPNAIATGVDALSGRTVERLGEAYNSDDPGAALDEAFAVRTTCSR